MTGNLGHLGIREMLRAFATGAVRPIDAVSSAIRRIDETDSHLRATITVCSQEASAMAASSSDRWEAGKPRPLEGVPFGVKDIIATRDVETTGGSNLYKDWLPNSNASIVQRLIDAGAILVAKLATHEFAFGHRVNRHFGHVANPWDLARTSGGSSSGSAAAVAAGQLPLTIGTDTGGSVRIPAGYCGVTGLKPTYGLVPRTGVMPLSWTLDHVGPLARSVDDIALALEVIAGADGLDSTCRVQSFVASRESDIDGVRVGIPEQWFFDICEAEIVDGTWKAARILEAAGATIVRIDLPHMDLAQVIGYTIILGEIATLHAGHLHRLGEYDYRFARHLALAQLLHAGDYTTALRARSLIQDSFTAAFDNVDVILTPVSPVVAPQTDLERIEIDGISYDWPSVVSRLTFPFSIAGVPALALPAGFGRGGMPFAIQVAGRPHHDETVLRVGRSYQALTDHHLKRPPETLIGVGT